MRHRGWRRVGITIAMLWAISISTWLWYHLAEEQKITAEIHIGSCLNSPSIDPDLCQANYLKELGVYRRNLWILDLTMVIVPVLLVWGSISGIFAIGQWIQKGFKEPVT